MTVERSILVSVLRLTRSGPVAKRLVAKDAGVPIQVVDDIMRRFCLDKLFRCVNGLVEASTSQRVNIAIQAVGLGADLEKVGRALDWIEFENITAQAFEAHKFSVETRFRFKASGRRWEVDILALRNPLILCVDCKRWRHGWGKSATAKAVEAQVQRTQALAKASTLLNRRAALAHWKEAILVPVVLSLVAGPLKFHMNTPIVPILQLRDFLNEVYAHLDMITNFVVRY